jgi:hypothetical protein
MTLSEILLKKLLKNKELKKMAHFGDFKLKFHVVHRELY